MEVCGMYYIGLNHQVIINKLGPEFIVGTNTADLG